MTTDPGRGTIDVTRTPLTDVARRTLGEEAAEEDQRGLHKEALQPGETGEAGMTTATDMTIGGGDQTATLTGADLQASILMLETETCTQEVQIVSETLVLPCLD